MNITFNLNGITYEIYNKINIRTIDNLKINQKEIAKQFLFKNEIPFSNESNTNRLVRLCYDYLNKEEDNQSQENEIKINIKKKNLSYYLNDFSETVNIFLNDIKEDFNGRYKSFNHCFLTFRKLFEICKKQDVSDSMLDYSALHLAFYLASWGMYRGSSMLLQKDYLIHVEAIKILLKSDYRCLYSLSPNEYTDITYNEFDRVVSELSAYYSGIKGKFHNKEKHIGATDTLISKILIATLGCTSAFDRYVKAGMILCKIPYSGLNSKTIKTLKKVCADNQDTLDSLMNKIKQDNDFGFYPIMKLLDSYFFELGLRADG
jgi:hypothetical protein